MSTGEGIRLQPRPSICREYRGRGGRGVVVTSSSESNCAVTVSTPRAVNNNNIRQSGAEICQNPAAVHLVRTATLFIMNGSVVRQGWCLCGHAFLRFLLAIGK